MTPEEMATLHARGFAGQERGWSAGEFAGLLQSPHVFVLGDACAFALGRAVADEAELLTLGTDPAYRRQGLARAVLRAFEEAAARRGALHAFLEVAADNHAALALYRSRGFNEIARREGYYPRATAPAVAALILEKRLNGG